MSINKYEDKYKDFLDDLLSQPNHTATPAPLLPNNKPKEVVATPFIPKSENHNFIPRPHIVANNANSMMFEDVVTKDLPMFEFYFPGTRIQFRDLKVKEIEHFSTLDESSIFDFKEKLNDILENCVLFNQSDGSVGSYLDLMEGDRLWLIYMIREKTFPKGKILTVNVEYKEGKETKNVDIELVRANIELYENGEIMEYFDREKRCLVFNTELQQEPFYIAPPTIGLKRCFDLYLKTKVENKEKVNVKFFEICPYLKPHQIYISYEELNKLYEWFEDFITPDEYFFLNDLINNHMKIGIRGLKKKVGTRTHRTDKIYSSRLKNLFLLPNAFNVFIKK